MPRVRVTPFIGEPSRDRLHSMQGTHAIHERAVTKPCSSEDVGEVITECIQELMLMDARQRKYFNASEVKVIVEFLL